MWSKIKLIDVLIRYFIVMVMLGGAGALFGIILWEVPVLPYIFVGLTGAAMLFCTILLIHTLVKKDLSGLLYEGEAWLLQEDKEGDQK